MLSSKRKCRSTWNIPSWHPLSLHPKLRSLWPVLSPVCRVRALILSCQRTWSSGVHGSFTSLGLSEVPSHPSARPWPSCCRKYQGPSGGHGANSLHSSAGILQPPSSDILLSQAEPQRVLLTKVWQHERQISTYWEVKDAEPEFRLNQLSWSPRQHSNNSNGNISIYSYIAAPFRKYSRNAAEVSGYSKLILQVIQMPARKTAYSIREHCWDQT